MKNIYSVMGILLVLLPSCLDFRNSTTNGYKDQEQIIFTEQVNSKPTVTIESGAGNIELHTWDNQKVSIEANIRAESKQELSYIEPDIKISSHSISIRTHYKRKNVKAVIDYDIKIPQEANIKEIETGSGTIEITGIKGNVSVRSGSGRIDIKKAMGEIEAETGSGSITINSVKGANDTIKASTGSGTIFISNAMGSVKAKSGSGNIHISCDEGSQGTIQANTGSGRIEVSKSCSSVNVSTGSGTIIISQKTLPLESVIDANTSSGRIELRIPFNSDADLHLFSPRGRFITNFAVKNETDRRDITGIIGKGGAKISLRSANGNIKVVHP